MPFSYSKPPTQIPRRQASHRTHPTCQRLDIRRQTPDDPANRIGSNHTTHTSHPRTHTDHPAKTTPPMATSLHPSCPARPRAQQNLIHNHQRTPHKP